MPDPTHQPASSSKKDETTPTGTTAEARKPSAPAPAVGDFVTYTYDHVNGARHTQRGIVLSVDTDNESAEVNWLPDAVAQVPFADLDQPQAS